MDFYSMFSKQTLNILKQLKALLSTFKYKENQPNIVIEIRLFKSN